jgi:hypothetical protein
VIQITTCSTNPLPEATTDYLAIDVFVFVSVFVC